MKTIFREFVADIKSGKNIDVYITILLNSVLAVLSLFELVPFHIFSAVVLGSMSWLILNALGEQKRNQEISLKLEKQLASLHSPPKAKDFFSENYLDNSERFRDAFGSAKELTVMGQGQARMIIGYGESIRQILANGGKVKFILGDPDGKGTEMAVNRSLSVPKIEWIRQEHWSAVQRLTAYARNEGVKDALKIKFVDILFPYTLYGFDLSSPENGKIFVWMTPLKKSSNYRAGFFLSAKNDDKWYTIFKEQFNLMWSTDISTDYTPSS